MTFQTQTKSLLSLPVRRSLYGDVLSGVVPSHSGLAVVHLGLFPLELTQLLLPLLLPVPHLLTVLVHAHTSCAHHVQVLIIPEELGVALGVAPRTSMTPPQSCSPSTRISCLGLGCCHALLGYDLEVVAGQDLGEGVLQRGTAVEASVPWLQPLHQETPLHVDHTILALEHLNEDSRARQEKVDY